MTDEVILTNERSSEILRITLNRPDKLNALNQRLLENIIGVLRDANTNYSVVIIEGRGEAFSAGADVDEIQDDGDASSLPLFQDLTRCVRGFRGVVIGQLHGWVVGGGFEWALSFDLRYAARDTTFRMPEAQLGVSVSNASTVLLPLTIGAGRAREVLFTDTDLTADEAHEVGLVAGVYGHDDLEAEVNQVAEEIVESTAREALWVNKQGYNMGVPIETALQTESLLGELLLGT